MTPRHAGRATLGSVSACELERWLAAGDTLLVGIREAEEHARDSLPGALSVPLSSFPGRLNPGPEIGRVVFHCQSGRRTRLAARRLGESIGVPGFALVDGIDGRRRTGT